MAELRLIVPSNPTPNGDLHLGHLAGPYIAADVLRRAAGAAGDTGAVLLGTAWQNTHVLLAAQKQRRDYLEVAAAYAARIEASFAAAAIGYDVMLRHADMPDIAAATRRAWQRLRERGALVVRTGAAHYCAGCADWRFQGYVAGICPHCGSPDAAGVDCEGCAMYHDDAELRDARCTVCGAATVLRPLQRAYLELEPQRAWFEDYFARAALGAPVRRFVDAVLAGRLPDVGVSLHAPIGIPLDDDPALRGQRIFPAFELAPRYAVMLARYETAHALRARDDGMTMLFGFDNAFERTFLFPAVLRALEPQAVPQADVMQLSFFSLLDGSKFSTSRGHVVGVETMVDAVGADAVRLYLAATRPEAGPTDFRRAELEASAELRAVRSLQAAADGGTWPPSAPGALGAGGNGALPRLAEVTRRLHHALQPATLSCRDAAGAVVQLTALAAAAEEGAPRAAVLSALVNGAAPLIPATAERLRAAFGVPRVPFRQCAAP